RVTVMYAGSLGISSKSARTREAWEYIKYMTSEAVQTRRLATGLAISGNRKAAAHFAGNEAEDAFLAQVKFARPPWGSRAERYELVEDLGREMMEDIFNAGVGVDEAVRRAAELADGVVGGNSKFETRNSNE